MVITRANKQWQPTPVLSPGKSHGRRSLVRYSPQGRKESDMTEHLPFLSLGVCNRDGPTLNSGIKHNWHSKFHPPTNTELVRDQWTANKPTQNQKWDIRITDSRSWKAFWNYLRIIFAGEKINVLKGRWVLGITKQVTKVKNWDFLAGSIEKDTVFDFPLSI